MTNKMLIAIRERARERAEKWKGFEVIDLPDPFQLRERAILGSYSYTLQINRIRLLRKYTLIGLGDGIKETPSTIARDYLTLTYKKSPKITHEQAIAIGAFDTDEKRNLKPYPLYAMPGRFEHGLYIDIKSTFWSVLKIAGWNVDYYPGEWISAGRKPSDFPFPDHKQARSCLVSVARPGKILFYVPVGKFEEHKAGSHIINLSISKLISDVLNSIAATAVSMGAVYANTDGYICPSEKIAAHVAQMILDWGLEPRVKGEGRGAVRGIGAYKVGDVVSEPYKVRGVAPDSMESLHPPEYSRWLQPRFAKIAA